ncbi:MAG: TetR family transcriptional regulator [Phycicoccus sp.]
MSATSSSAPTAPATSATGRRARKRLVTRQSLVDAAVALFAEKGFDRVTVTEIADRADVDASTFFRHFGSKDAVLFTDWADLAEHIGPTLEARPAEEPLLEAFAGVILELSAERPFDPDMDLLRTRLITGSSSLRALSLVYRERLVDALTEAIARRLGVDPATDGYPYLTATVWAAGLDLFRRQAVASPGNRRRARSSRPALLDDVVTMIRRAWREPETGKRAAAAPPSTPARRTGSRG